MNLMQLAHMKLKQVALYGLWVFGVTLTTIGSLLVRMGLRARMAVWSASVRSEDRRIVEYLNTTSRKCKACSTVPGETGLTSCHGRQPR